MDQPPDLPAQDELEALEVELPRGVAGEVARRFLLGLLLLARDPALLLAEVVILVVVDLDVALVAWSQHARERVVSSRWITTTHLNAMAVLAVPETALCVPSFRPALIAAFTRREPVEFFAFPAAGHFLVTVEKSANKRIDSQLPRCSLSAGHARG